MEYEFFEPKMATRNSLTNGLGFTQGQASDVSPAYPVWHQRGFPMLNERAG